MTTVSAPCADAYTNGYYNYASIPNKLGSGMRILTIYVGPFKWITNFRKKKIVSLAAEIINIFSWNINLLEDKDS